ncbi:MAG: helix-hairpin-helix domain-containing protein [Weeksellaceae bacterium]|nr:helix-hairpin-helix domain-containing protein [Weeksellaceae bacterium]
MKSLSKDRWHFTFGQRIGIFILLLTLLCFELVLAFQNKPKDLSLHQIDTEYYKKLEIELEQLIEVQKSKPFKKSSFTSNHFKKDSLKPFNPNDLPKQGWEQLGFTPKQAEVIMKYKQILGGKFESKEQIKKCYVISDEAYEVLAPYILLPDKAKSDYKLEKSQTSKKINYRNFNPNDYSIEDWVAIGFSPKQAETILKYKNIVGGEFKSKEQLKKCYVISDEKYNEMKNFINLPEKVEVNYTKNTIDNSEPKNIPTTTKSEVKKVEITEKFNPNDLDLEGWMKLGFSEKQAQTILNFKRSLGGKFKDAKTLSRSYVITEEKFKEMEPYLVFD